jgi:hypothetical protein
MEELLALLGVGLGVGLGPGVVRAVGRGLVALASARGPAVDGYAHVARGHTWYLHRRVLTLPSGRERRLFYFAREARPAELVDRLPAGFLVVENSRTGVPLLKRSD